MTSIKWQGAVSAIGISVLWGGNIVAIKIALQGIQPMMMAGLTFLLGSIAVLLWARVDQIEIRPTQQEIPYHLLNGLLFTLQVAFFYFGAHLTSASHTVIITNTNIFFVALLAHFFIPGDRLTVTKGLGLILAFTGVAYLFLEQPALKSQASVSGNFIVLVSAFLLGLRIIYVKRLIERLDPTKVTLWQMVIGSSLLLALAISFEGMSIDLSSFPVFIALLYQGIVVAGFTFVASTLLLKRYSPTSLSVFFFTVPIAGVLLSHWILDEAITQNILVSVILVAVGIWLVQLKERGIIVE